MGELIPIFKAPEPPKNVGRRPRWISPVNDRLPTGYKAFRDRGVVEIGETGQWVFTIVLSLVVSIAAIVLALSLL